MRIRKEKYSHQKINFLTSLYVFITIEIFKNNTSYYSSFDID